MLRPSLFTLPPNIRISEQITNKRILKWVVCLFCNGWYLCWRWAKNTSLDETVPLLKNLYICVESSIIHNQKVETIQKSNNWQRDKQNVVYPNRILSSNKKVHAGLPRCHSGKEPTCQCRRLRRHRFDSWVGKMLWRRKRQHSSILAWEIPWTEETGGLQSMGLQRDTIKWACMHTHTHTGTCCNRDEPWKPYAKWNTPVTEDCILFDSMDTTEWLSTHI